MSKLSMRRKADREKAAAILIAAMREAGAQAAICDEWPGDGREIMVRILAPGGAYAGVLIDGDRGEPQFFLATWNTPSGVYINPGMGSVNPHHYGKCTRSADEIHYFAAILASDVARFKQGDGYLRHDSPQLLAMAERYAAQGWPCVFGFMRPCPNHWWSVAA